MKSKLFSESVKTEQLASEKWIRIFPDTGKGYRLYDPLNDNELGRILVDHDENWIYDGDRLSIDEQEDIAASILGYGKEMERLLESLTKK
jgi:hypothetical protein